MYLRADVSNRLPEKHGIGDREHGADILNNGRGRVRDLDGDGHKTKTPNRTEPTLNSSGNGKNRTIFLIRARVRASDTNLSSPCAFVIYFRENRAN